MADEDHRHARLPRARWGLGLHSGGSGRQGQEQLASVHTKNVNISNVLRNDSLALNVKLSNADDANQLDLNGLVEFAGEQTAKISILPSNLKINSEDWNIQDKVRISFDSGKTQIDGFSLSKLQCFKAIDDRWSDFIALLCSSVFGASTRIWSRGFEF